MKNRMIITSEVRNNIENMIKSATQTPLMCHDESELEYRVACLRQARIGGLMVGYSLDVVEDRWWFQHLSVSDHGETPLPNDVATLASAFGLSNCSACSTPMATHVFQIVPQKMH